MANGVGRVVDTRKAERKRRTFVRRNSMASWVSEARRMLARDQPIMRRCRRVLLREAFWSGRPKLPWALAPTAADGKRKSKAKKRREGRT